ncbi:hypothetical protein C2857_006780 [Epichloe festucae Fl1]|uniref:Uncharacterized protein n=1 Tax=Epichloe festucae (strain Fl1) TaxID=877507 RepID=A0A7S9KQ96_EPIFF|nr:hypothetical protein C2857_006780 [Epichloe festucae Fl1]
MLVKWALQLSASARTPEWATGLVKEVLLFKLARLFYNHPFNRMAWVVLQECSPKEFDPNHNMTRRLGYAMSCVAKLIYSVDKDDHKTQDFWNSTISQVFIHLYTQLIPTPNGGHPSPPPLPRRQQHTDTGAFDMVVIRANR